MTTWDDERWRGGYDAWKLATPPEYDTPGPEPGPDVEGEQEHPFPAALDDFIDNFCNDIGADTDTLCDAMEAKIMELRRRDRILEGESA